VLGLAITAAVVAGCDHGSALMVENQTDSDYVVRTTGSTYSSDHGDLPDQIVVTAPANSKHVVVIFGFAGGFTARQLEILRQDCTPIYSQPFFRTDGTYVVIDDNAVVSIRKEFPQNGDPAQATDTCRTMAPFPSPS